MEIAALGSLALVGAGVIGLGISHKKARRKQKERALTSHSNAKPLCSNIQTYSFSSPNSSPHGQCVNVTNGAGTVAYTFQKITPNIPGRFAKWGMMDNTSNRQIATVNMSPLDTHMEVEDIVRKIVRKIQVKMKKKGAYRQFEVSNCEGNVNALANIPPSVYRWNTYSYHLERILNAACAVYPSPDVPKPYMIPPQTSTVNTVEIVGRARNLNCESFNCQLDLDPKKVDTRCALASAFMNILSSWKRQRKEKAAFKKAKFKKFKIFSKMNIFSKKNKGRCEVSIQQLQPCYIHNQCASPGQPCQFCPLLRKLKYTKKKHLKKLTKTKGFLPCSKNEPNYCNTQGTQCNNESQNSRFPYTQINLLGGQITMDQSNGLEPENTYRVIQPQCYNNNNNVNTNNDNTMLEDTMCSNVPIAYQPITPQIQYPIQPQPNITVNIDSCSEENCKKCKRHSENTKKKNKISELSNSMVTPSQDKQTFSSSKPSKREKACFKKSKLSTLEAGLKSTGKSLFHKRNDSVTSLSTLGSSINSQSYMSSRPNSSYSITSSLISKESRSCPFSAGSLLKKFRGNKLKRKLREKKNMLKSRSKSCRHRSKKSHQNSNGSCSSLNLGSHSKRVSFDRKRHYHYPKSYSSFKHRNHLEESPSFRVSKSSSSQCSIKSPKFFNKSKKYFTGCQNPDQKPSYSRQHTTETLGHSIDPFCNPIMQHPLPYNDSHRPLYVRSQIGTENPQYYVQPLGKGGPNPDTYMNQQQFSQYVPQTQNSNFRQRQEFSKAGIPSNQFNVQNLTSQAAIPNSEAYIPMNRYSKIAIKGHNYHHSPKTGQYANPIQKSKQNQHVSFKASASQREQSEMGYVQNSLGLGSKNPFNDNIRENRNFSMSRQFATSQLNLSCSSSDYTDIKSSNCSAESIPVGGVYYAATSPRPCSSSSSKYSSILTKEGQDFFFEPAVNIKNKSRTESFEQFNMEESSFRSPSLQGKSHVAINDQIAQHNKQHMMLQQMEFKNALRKKQANDMKQQDLYKRQIELEKKAKEVHELEARLKKKEEAHRVKKELEQKMTREVENRTRKIRDVMKKAMELKLEQRQMELEQEYELDHQERLEREQQEQEAAQEEEERLLKLRQQQEAERLEREKKMIQTERLKREIERKAQELVQQKHKKEDALAQKITDNLNKYLKLSDANIGRKHQTSDIKRQARPVSIKRSRKFHTEDPSIYMNRGNRKISSISSIITSEISFNDTEKEEDFYNEHWHKLNTKRPKSSCIPISDDGESYQDETEDGEELFDYDENDQIVLVPRSQKPHYSRPSTSSSYSSYQSIDIQRPADGYGPNIHMKSSLKGGINVDRRLDFESFPKRQRANRGGRVITRRRKTIGKYRPSSSAACYRRTEPISSPVVRFAGDGNCENRYPYKRPIPSNYRYNTRPCSSPKKIKRVYNKACAVQRPIYKKRSTFC